MRLFNKNLQLKKKKIFKEEPKNANNKQIYQTKT